MMSPLPHRKLIRGAIAGALACASLLSCQERLATDEDQEERYTWCVVVNAARVYDEEGNNAGLVRDAKGDQTWVCWCLTMEEGLSGDWDTEANDTAYEVCKENATAMGYPEANDCAYYHSINHWGEHMFGFPYEGEPRVCDPDGASADGCNVE